MENKEIKKILNLLNPKEITSQDIFEERPYLKEKSSSILDNINRFVKESKTEEALPWLKKADMKKAKFKKAQRLVLDELDKFKKLAKDIVNGHAGPKELKLAQQFFRERNLENLSEEEIVELLIDLDLLDNGDEN